MEREELLMDALWKMFQRRWALDKTVWRQASEDLNPTELRCIEYVGNHANVNATRLAEAFFMTTGATSKLTKKLLAKGFLVRYQKEITIVPFFPISHKRQKGAVAKGEKRPLRHGFAVPQFLWLLRFLLSNCPPDSLTPKGRGKISCLVCEVARNSWLSLWESWHSRSE